MGDALSRHQVLIRVLDSKFTRLFDEVFRSEGLRILRTPVRSPRANAFAERFVGTLRRACRAWILLVNERLTLTNLRGSGPERKTADARHGGETGDGASQPVLRFQTRTVASAGQTAGAFENATNTAKFPV